MAADFEFVAVDLRLLPHVIDDQDLVGQIQHQIALIVGAWQPQLHRLELEDEIVAERTVKPEMLVLRAGEQFPQRPQHREDRWLTAALFLRKTLAAFPYVALDPVGAAMPDSDRVERRQMIRDGGQQHRAAFVERLDRKRPSARGQHERRIDKPHVPSCVAARKLEARREQHAAPLVEALGQRAVGRAVGLHRDFAVDPNPAPRLVGLTLHGTLRVEPSRSLPEPSR